MRPDGLRDYLRTDMMAGALFIGFGLLGLWLSRDYSMGTLQSMSTGYFPRLVCYGLIILGAAIAWTGFQSRAPEPESPPLSRAVLLIPVAVAVFGWAIEKLGLVLALLVMLSIGALAGRGLRPLSFAVAAASLVVVCLLIFVWGLRMPIDIWLPA